MYFLLKPLKQHTATKNPAVNSATFKGDRLMKFYRIWYRGYADVEADSEEEAVDRYLDDPSCAGDDDLDITDVYELEEDNNA